MALAVECPLPVSGHKQIVIGHGSGGRLSAQLIAEIFVPAFDNEILRRMDDQAVLDLDHARVAFTTDSFVVTPIFFPGGDIGDLAVNGTVNDLAMSGAKPLYLSAAFIIEEGFPMDDLRRVVDSMSRAARAAQVAVVTGDTKVVNKGCADKIFITTAGVGLVPAGIQISAVRARAGDAILLSGTIGDHGMAVMAQREGLDFEGELVSDTRPLHNLVAAMIAAGEVHALRDPTRGGLAASLCEIAKTSATGIEIDARAVPVRENVRGACEVLGLDPLFVANEGKLLAFVAAADAPRILAAMRALPEGEDAALIGHVTGQHPAMTIVTTEIGGSRVLDLPFNEQLPRIC
jgi:hydrogenase expression/formation protein HypE